MWAMSYGSSTIAFVGFGFENCWICPLLSMILRNIAHNVSSSHGEALVSVKSRKLVFNPDFLLWACLIPDEDPIPLIQSLGSNMTLLKIWPKNNRSFEKNNVL